MYYGNIKKTDVADGPGVRVTLFVSGCRNQCRGCQNYMTWDFNYGKLFTEETKKEIIESLKPDFIEGFTLCGGEPFEEENQQVLSQLVKEIKEIYPNKSIWSYSGYLFEDLTEGGKKHCEYTDALLENIDVLIEGPFILELRDISGYNLWRGSINQRIIDVKESLKQNKKVYLKGILNNN